VLKTQDFSLIFKHYWGYFNFFGRISDGSTRHLRCCVHSFEVGVVHSFELGVASKWFREYGVSGFESMGYLVS